MKACHIHDPARWDRTLCGLRLYMGVPSKRCPIYGELPTSHRAEWYLERGHDVGSCKSCRKIRAGLKSGV